MLFKMSLDMIGSVKPQPNRITGCVHLCNQIIWFSIEMFTFQVTLKMEKKISDMICSWSHLIKPYIILHPRYVELVLTWNRSFTGDLHQVSWR